MKKTRPRFRFMAMSKLIGLVTFIFIFAVTIYSMYEMHYSGNYDALPQLIISAFGFGSIYAGFYLTMAKVEHVEEERTKREKELALLKSSVTKEEIEEKRTEINNLTQQIGDLLNEQSQPLM